jgi:hypothetical protein
MQDESFIRSRRGGTVFVHSERGAGIFLPAVTRFSRVYNIVYCGISARIYNHADTHFVSAENRTCSSKGSNRSMKQVQYRRSIVQKKKKGKK